MATPAYMTQGEISFSKNGRDLGVAFKLPPGAKGPFFPAVALKSAQVRTPVCHIMFNDRLLDARSILL